LTGKPHALHPAIGAFPVRNGCIEIGGIALPRLAERIGQTPFFVYDRRLLDARIAHLRKHLPKEIALHYAIKANPMPAVVQHLRGLVDGFDVASSNEMRVALDTTMPATRVSFAGPGKTEAELAQALAADITIEVESMRELQAIAALAERSGHSPRIALRINPDFDVKGSGMRMGGGPAQFGIDAEQAPEALRELKRLGLNFVGLHIFAGSQNLRADLLQEIQTRTIELAISLSAHAPGSVRHLNIGGGFGIPYFPKDTPLDIGPIGENLATLIEKRVKPLLPEAHLIIELGRYIVGECGLYVSRIIDRKVSRGETFLVTDGGLHHQLAASGNFGQVIRRNYPVAIGNRMGEAATETASVVGCLCTPLDLLADKAELPHADVGDLVVVFQSGAYGLTASPTAFLSHPPPVEVLV
jgi:diaminopimelate decarboxylase